MPLTTLDTKAALVVIDLQKGIAGMATVHPMADIIGRTAQLARAFRKRGLPVVLVNANGRAPGRTDAAAFAFPSAPHWAELVPELEPQPHDHLVTKQRWGAFIGTPLDQYLRGHDVTQIVMTGVATSIGVESTARSGYDHGYNVVFVTDAMTDRDADAHQYSVEKIFPRMGETTTTDALLARLT